MKRTLAFAAACLTITAAALGVMLLVFREADERRALWVGAAITMVVQLATFSVARAMRHRNVIAGWGLGVALRFAALAVFALVVAPGLGLPLTAALLGMAVFLFLSTLVEPLFLTS
ncbi:MAG TPA: hypothetical protein VLE53_02360 [Gemmatimonadaceae bacterium]|nr:hypothetical protein [Gemmatimonadaceae bacterium]